MLCRPVDLIEIDYIDVQPAQTIFALAANGAYTEVAMDISLFVCTQTTLSENVGPRSGPGFQRRRDHFFRVAHSINGGRVDPVDTKLERPMDRGDRLFVILLAPAKLPACTTDTPGAEDYWCDR